LSNINGGSSGCFNVFSTTWNANGTNYVTNCDGTTGGASISLNSSLVNIGTLINIDSSRIDIFNSNLNSNIIILLNTIDTNSHNISNSIVNINNLRKNNTVPFNVSNCVFGINDFQLSGIIGTNSYNFNQ